jgi:hypothetical protein
LVFTRAQAGKSKNQKRLNLLPNKKAGVAITEKPKIIVESIFINFFPIISKPLSLMF